MLNPELGSEGSGFSRYLYKSKLVLWSGSIPCVNPLSPVASAASFVPIVTKANVGLVVATCPFILKDEVTGVETQPLSTVKVNTYTCGALMSSTPDIRTIPSVPKV